MRINNTIKALAVALAAGGAVGCWQSRDVTTSTIHVVHPRIVSSPSGVLKPGWRLMQSVKPGQVGSVLAIDHSSSFQ